MKDQDELIKNLCDALELSAKKVGGNSLHDVLVMLYYESAIRTFQRKAFREDRVQTEILAFLERKLDEVTEVLMRDVNYRLKTVLSKYEEKEEE